MSMPKDEIPGEIFMRLHDLQTAISRARDGIGALVDKLDAEPTSDIAGTCDDMRVLTDIATKTDGAIGELLKIHEQIGRKMNDRILKLKDAAP